MYSCSIKIQALGFDLLLENIFCTLLVVEVVFPEKVVEMLNGMPVYWGRGQLPTLDKANLVT